jgi:hypothetical protein
MYVVKNSFKKSKESKIKEITIKFYEGTLYCYLFIRQVSQMELFYLNLSEVCV